MQAFDASSIIFAWDTYPVDQFPPLWNWIAAQIRDEAFLISKVAFEEVDRKSPDCGEWLRDNDIRRVDMSNEIIQEALRIKTLLGIQADKYHPNGVGENDLLIIATASIWQVELVSDEGRQLLAPQNMTKMKSLRYAAWVPSRCRA